MDDSDFSEVAETAELHADGKAKEADTSTRATHQRRSSSKLPLPRLKVFQNIRDEAAANRPMADDADIEVRWICVH